MYSYTFWEKMVGGGINVTWIFSIFFMLSQIAFDNLTNWEKTGCEE